MDLTGIGDRILDELRPGLSDHVLEQISLLSQELAATGCIACHGVGREGLMMKALAMRLYHLGLDAHVVGDMTTPALTFGDTLLVSAGPGQFSTIQALCGVAKDAGAQVICLTAEPDGSVPRAADRTIILPAQTMASDQGNVSSVLPMGSLYEAMMFLVFEVLVLDLRARLDVRPEAMRARHTNLE